MITLIVKLESDFSMQAFVGIHSGFGQREHSAVDTAATDIDCQAPRANSPGSVQNLLNICCVLCQAEQLSVWCRAAYSNSCSNWKQHEPCFFKANQINAKFVCWTTNKLNLLARFF